MAGCPPFTITVREDLNTALARVKQKAAEKGITFIGDTQRGSFSGDVSGTYSVSGNQVTVKISSRPFIYPCGVIESELRKYFEG